MIRAKISTLPKEPIRDVLRSVTVGLSIIYIMLGSVGSIKSRSGDIVRQNYIWRMLGVAIHPDLEL